ncbi:hypothetical protein PC129_g24341, partial [Phytophthora cactorum]
LPKDKRGLTRYQRRKAVKPRDNLTVCKECDPLKIIADEFDTPEHQRLAEDEWQIQKLLVVSALSLARSTTVWGRDSRRRVHAAQGCYRVQIPGGRGGAGTD